MNLSYMKPTAMRIKLISTLIGIAISINLSALTYDIETIEIRPEHNIDVIPFITENSASEEILIIETPDVDQLKKQIRGLNNEPIRRVKIFRYSPSGWRLHLSKDLEDSMDLIDTVRTPKGIELVGYQNSQLLYLNKTTRNFEKLLESPSVFSGVSWGSSPLVNMFVDLNNDGLDDFLIPSFEGWQIALQTNVGFRPLQTLGPLPSMTFSESALYTAYRAEEAFLLDENTDGLKDIAFWKDGSFSVYRQNNQGGFSPLKNILDVNLKDMLSGYSQISVGENNDDNNKGKTRLLDDVLDINNDGYSDLIVKRIKAEGIFGWESEYEIYLGRPTADNRLEFLGVPSSVVRTDGFQFNNEHLDLSGDGNQEFVITSVDISLGAVIRVLISRSVSVDISIYRMANGHFSDKPNVKKNISARFDFGSGELFVPAVLGADITGDGQKDLLVQKGDNTLLVYPGQRGLTMFAPKPIKLKLKLPKSQTGFIVSDLNNDGRDELILKRKEDGEIKLSVVRFKN